MTNHDTREAQILIGRAIRTLREQRGLTLEQLAPLGGITYQYLSGLENGRENFTIGVLQRLSAALRFPLKSLITLAYENPEQQQVPKVNSAHFRRNVPLPGALTVATLEDALNRTQAIFFSLTATCGWRSVAHCRI